MSLKDKLLAKDTGMSITTAGALLALVVPLLGGGWWFANVLGEKANASDMKASQQVQQEKINYIYDRRITAKVRDIAALEAMIKQAGVATAFQLEQLKILNDELKELRALSHK